MGRPALRRRAVAPAALLVVLALVSAAAGAAGPAPVVTVTQTLTGLDDVLSGGFEPPDVQVAAGPGYVVQLVNLAERLWRTGAGPAQLVGTQPLGAFFRTGDRLTDPRILYDALSGRWLASASDLDAETVVLAVSPGSDPTAPWNTYPLDAGGCADQPRLGVDDGVVVVAADIFPTCESDADPPGGSKLWVVNKQQLLDGAATPALATYGPERLISSFAPVQSLSPTPTEFVVSVDEPGSRVLHLFTIDGIPPDPVSVQQVASPSIQPLTDPPAGVEPPATAAFRQPRVATNDDRVLEAVWEQGKLWLTANTGCMPAGDSVGRSCGRVLELSTDTQTVDWSLDIGGRGAYAFYPAVRPDAAGNLVIVYGTSSATLEPSVLVVARSPDGVLSAPAMVARGTSQELGERYGDYFGAARDPVTGAVWVSGELGAAAPGDRGWTTVVASAAVTAAGGEPPAVLDAAAPRVEAQGLRARAGTSVRLRYRILDSGPSVHALLTVSGRHGSVFAASTAPLDVVAGRAYSVPWRTPKRQRGLLSFCVRSVTAAGKQSAESCATVQLR